MKFKFAEKIINYDGSLLKPLYAYIHHQMHGDSIVSFIGNCDVTFEHMIDAEDLVAQENIKSNKMLHFIIEIFNQNLMTAVSLQRLLTSLAQDLIDKNLRREGDDLYLDHATGVKKLSVSIASISSVSAMIHFGINITNEGTPVATCSLQDLGIEAKEFALSLMKKFSEEYVSIQEATQKVRPL